MKPSPGQPGTYAPACAPTLCRWPASGGRRELADGFCGVKPANLVVAALLLALLPLQACRPSAERAAGEAPSVQLRLTSLSFEGRSGETAELTEAMQAALREAVEDATAASPAWAEEAGEGVLSVRLELRQELARTEDDRLGFLLAGALHGQRRSQLPNPPEASIAGLVALPIGDTTDIAPLVERLLDKLARQAAVATGPDDVVLAALSDSSTAVRVYAIREAEHRRLRSSIPLLRERLEQFDLRAGSEGGREFVAIVGALASMRDHAAVPDIIERVSMNEGPMLVAIIPAVARMGGEEAQAFLEVLASAHEVPAVREAARQALGL